jgi:hypothetical protein
MVLLPTTIGQSGLAGRRAVESIQDRSQLMGNHLRNLGNQVTVPLQPDEDGYIGRECPNQACLGYFKITFGTGVKGPARCHCPYCGHTGDQNTFFTQEQIEYGRSVAIRKVMDAFTRDLKSLNSSTSR